IEALLRRAQPTMSRRSARELRAHGSATKSLRSFRRRDDFLDQSFELRDRLVELDRDPIAPEAFGIVLVCPPPHDVPASGALERILRRDSQRQSKIGAGLEEFG